MKSIQINRMELAGSLGDLGTLLPLGIGMILINGLQPMNVFLAVGLYYVFSGLYFRVTTPVEPMKVISAYAVATGITAIQIQASSLLMGVFLLVIGATGLITLIGKYIPRPVIRGVQLSTGVLLASQGVKLMLGASRFQALRQAAEPVLAFQAIGPIPVGIVIGAVLGLLTLLLLDNKKTPAALVAALAGVAIGLLGGGLKTLGEVQVGLNLPQLWPHGLPSGKDLGFAVLILALPQLPMTLGNAVVANGDLAGQYFPKEGGRVTYKGLCISMGLANLGSFVLGGMPMCHGAGGLASRYRFGARTAGSNLIIGGIFIVLALLLGPHVLAVVSLIPLSALGVLLVFAGAQLALTLLDMKTRKDLFTPVLILGITLASNLAAGFIAGIIVAYALKSDRLQV